jgi:hypothetical protein
VNPSSSSKPAFRLLVRGKEWTGRHPCFRVGIYGIRARSRDKAALGTVVHIVQLCESFHAISPFYTYPGSLLQRRPRR